MKISKLIQSRHVIRWGAIVVGIVLLLAVAIPVGKKVLKASSHIAPSPQSLAKPKPDASRSILHSSESRSTSSTAWGKPIAGQNKNNGPGKKPIQGNPLLDALLDIKQQEGRDNAVIHYVTAYDILPRVAMGDALKQDALVKTVLAEGWSAKADVLLPLLAQFEPTFAEIRTGAALDYTRNIGWKDGIATPVPSWLHAQTSARMLCVEGRYLESKGDYSKALDNYLTVLTMGRDLGKNGAMLLAGMSSMPIQRQAAEQIQRLAASGHLDRPALDRAQTRLRTIEETQEPMTNWWLGEEAALKIIVDDMRIDLTKREMPSFIEIARLKMNKTKAEKTQIDQGIEKMKRWRQRIKAYDFDASVKPLRESIQKYFAIPAWQRSAKQREEYEASWKLFKDEFHSLADILSAFTFADLDDVSSRYDTLIKQLRQCRLAVAVAAYRVDKGQVPAQLGELVPKYIESLPVDPLSGKQFGNENGL